MNMLSQKIIPITVLSLLFLGYGCTKTQPEPIQAEIGSRPIENIASFGAPVIQEHYPGQATNIPEQRYENDKYIVITPNGYEHFGQEVIEKLPECEKSIEDFMGYQRPWDKRAYKFYITQEGRITDTVYLNHADKGTAYLRKITAVSREAKDCLDHMIAHESIHQFMPVDNKPYWVAEGVAEYFGEIYTDPKNTTRCGGYFLLKCSATVADKCISYPFTDLDVANDRQTRDTAMCLFDTLYEKGGKEKFRSLMRKIMLEPGSYDGYSFNKPTQDRETENRDFVERYIVPIYGTEIWTELKRFGIDKK